MNDLLGSSNIGKDRLTINANFAECASHHDNEVIHTNAAERDTNMQTANDLTVHMLDLDNPHNVTAAQVGLGNVDNTSDADKPVSTAQQAALDSKEPLSPYVRKTLSAVGWYRAFEIPVVGTSFACIMNIAQHFSNIGCTTHQLSIAYALTDTAFTLLSSKASSRIGIDAVRILRAVTNPHLYPAYIDIHYAFSNSNVVKCQMHDYTHSQASVFVSSGLVASDIPDGYTSREYDLTVGDIATRIAALEAAT